MICNETKKKVKSLIAKGYVENVDFRVMHFGDQTEIKIITK